LYIRLVSKYYLGDQIKNNEMGGVCSIYGGEERGDADRVLVAKPKGKIQFVRNKHRWEDNIKLDLQEVGGGMVLVDLAQDRERW
jgi:hypothetical protein